MIGVALVTFLLLAYPPLGVGFLILLMIAPSNRG